MHPPLYLSEGLAVEQKISASIANLGAGFDSIGLALGIYDHVYARIVAQGITITIEGEGIHSCPRDNNHLVIQGIDAILKIAGVKYPGIELHCKNTIPHARGLGSSAAAFCAGIAIGKKLLACDQAYHSLPSTEQLIDIAGKYEGHADNSSASILGGAIISWYCPDETDSYAYRAVNIPILDAIRTYVCIPDMQGFTSYARQVLPHDISREQAVYNLSRSALLVHGLCHDPQVLFTATQDSLHQPYRQESQLESYALMKYFRHHQIAACIGGAGPTVAVIGCDEDGKIYDFVQREAVKRGFVVIAPEIGRGIEQL